MSGENNFKDTVNSLFKGLDAFISAKTVVGEAIHVGDTIILPLVDVSFGVGAGAFEGDKKSNGGGGMTGKLTPSAVLVIQNGSTKLVNVKNQDGLTKVLDMVPDFVDRFASGFGKDDNNWQTAVPRPGAKKHKPYTEICIPESFPAYNIISS